MKSSTNTSPFREGGGARRRGKYFARRIPVHFRRLVRDDSGVALVFTIAIFLFLFVIILSIYSIGESIRQKEELQNACDAAAHAGAVAQADALSRMAVVNRAMAWNYIQMTKMQMDYITYKWLRVTCDNFAEDRNKCLRHTSPWLLLPDRTRGYAFIPDILDDIPGLGGLKTGSLGLPTKVRRIRWYIFDIGWAEKWLVFNCFHNTHNHGDNRISNYIGMRDGNSAPEKDADDIGRAEEIRVNGHDLDDLSLRFRSGPRSGAPYGGDLDLVVDGSVERSGILAEAEGLYGGYGCPDLEKQIQVCKGLAVTYYALLRDINGEMKDDISEAVVTTLRQNLPRRGDADPDDDILKDYYWFQAGGTSIEPREYAVANEEDKGEGGKAFASYFSGLRNTEQDEMVFLNMADGLPENARVTLSDYFADKDSDPIDGGGLDQWFIRCIPEESKNGSAVSIERDWVSPTPGIIRCYKNANYHDARSNAMLPPHDVHRGNYCFDGLQNFFDSLSGAVGSAISRLVSKIGFIGEIPFFGEKIQEAIGDAVKDIVKEICSGIADKVGADMIVPSCYNDRGSFPDRCAAIDNSWGLVAEYEWAAAYWLCLYEEKGIAPLLGVAGIDLAFPGLTKSWRYFKRGRWRKYKVKGKTDDISLCFHFPIPLGLMCGGATDNGYNAGPLFGFVRDRSAVIQNFTGNPKGHSRNDYFSECVFLDGEPFKTGCDKEVLPNGEGSNTLLKSYVRVYGDDKRAYDENYCGQYSMPWVLNENFFNGAGTIIVGLARKRRNAFEFLTGADIPTNSLYAAFSPPEGSHIVALSAARAAYAPRNGDGDASGADTANAGGGVRYDIHYDAVCKDLKPKLPRGKNPKDEWKQQAARLESAPFWIGCVCTDDSGDKASTTKMGQTANRLRRQWNLCQTDWDGVLLPLRFSRAALREFNSNPTGGGQARADADGATEWGPFASDYGENDAVFELAQILTMIEVGGGDASMLWHSFDGPDTKTLPNLLDRDSPSETLEFTEATRRRRVL